MGIRSRISRWLSPPAETPDWRGRVDLLEARIERLEKSLDMVRGAVQISADQWSTLRQELAETQRTAQQAQQVATSARHMTESLSEAIDDLETPSADAGPAVDQLLAGSVTSVKSALASGAWDHRLDALRTAESAGKARKGVLAAVDARQR